MMFERKTRLKTDRLKNAGRFYTSAVEARDRYVKTVPIATRSKISFNDSTKRKKNPDFDCKIDWFIFARLGKFSYCEHYRSLQSPATLRGWQNKRYRKTLLSYAKVTNSSSKFQVLSKEFLKQHW